jgi:hypothetical protein
MTKEHSEIDAVVRDYFEGWFDGDVERMDRALHPELVKRRSADLSTVTTKARMLELTAAGEGREDGRDRTLEVEVDDVREEIATARVRSAVYDEFVQLVRTDDGWKIANALWRLRA